ncbi:MAG: ATP synthase subunit I [Deltaproteobacteria bacterium]|nr:ATP synthase subunit I [Deltaproteobacteria bacterium]
MRKRKEKEKNDGIETESEAPKILTPEEALVLIREQERRLKRIQFVSLGLWLLLLVVGGILYHSLPVMLGLFLGGLIVVLNFYWLTRLVRRAFQERKKPTKSFFVKFGLKFFSLLAIVALVIYFTPVHPIAFLIGLSVSFFGITVDGLIGWAGMYKKKMR